MCYICHKFCLYFFRLLRFFPHLADFPAQMLLLQNIIRHTYVCPGMAAIFYDPGLHRKTSVILSVCHKMPCIVSELEIRRESAPGLLKRAWKNITHKPAGQLLRTEFLSGCRICVGNYPRPIEHQNHLQCILYGKHMVFPLIHTSPPKCHH